MDEAPEIFISAERSDLGTMRELVQRELGSMRCQPVEGRHWPADYRSAVRAIEQRIRGCAAVIHLAGSRYGAEPDPATLPKGKLRRSFAHLEVDAARRLKKRLYVFSAKEDFPFDASEEEPQIEAALQRAHRDEVVRHATRHWAVNDRFDLAWQVKELQPELERLPAASPVRRWRGPALVCGILLLLGGIGGGVWWLSHRTTVAQASVPDFDPGRIKASLEKQIRQQAAEATAEINPAEDAEFISDLEKTRNGELADLDHFIEPLRRVFEEQEASVNYRKATRLLAAKGVSEALHVLNATSDARGDRIAALQLDPNPAPAVERELRELRHEMWLAALLLEKSAPRVEELYRRLVDGNAEWIEPRLALGEFYTRQCTLVPDDLADEMLRQAVALAREAIALAPRGRRPLDWGQGHHALGVALWQQARRVQGNESLELLEQATAALRSALEVFPEDSHPAARARAQHAWARVRYSTGYRLVGAEGVPALEQAERAFRDALQFYTREQMPAARAEAQGDLALAYKIHAEHTQGAEKLPVLALTATAYREALRLRSQMESPHTWADLQLHLGIALHDQGVALYGPEGTQLLAAAAAAFRLAAEGFQKIGVRDHFAIAQNRVGYALYWDADRSTDLAESRRLLAEALAAYRLALTVYTPRHKPEEWANVHNNIGQALARRGDRETGPEAAKLWTDAMAAHRTALEIYTRDEFPEQWARTHTYLGTVLDAQARAHEAAAEKRRLLAEAAEVYREALAFYTKEEWPQEWAWAQLQFCGVLRNWAAESEGAESAALLAEAVAAGVHALEVFTRDEEPKGWAGAHYDLARARATQADAVGGAEGRRVRALALADYRAALQVYTPREWPEHWVLTQTHLGNACHEQGQVIAGEEGGRLLADSVRAYRASLEIQPPLQSADVWAETQNNLGNALQSQGDRPGANEPRARLFAEATVAYRAAMEIHTWQRYPAAWARTEANLGRALCHQAEMTPAAAEFRPLYEQAFAAYREAMQIENEEVRPEERARLLEGHAYALGSLGARTTGEEAQRCLTQCVAGYRRSLQDFAQVHSERARAALHRNAAIRLHQLGSKTEGAACRPVLAEAVSEYRTALAFFTREEWADDWAGTHSIMGDALRLAGHREEGAESRRLLQEALAAFRSEQEVHTPRQSPRAWVQAQATIGHLLREIGERSEGTERERCLAESVRILREVTAP